MKQRSRRGHEDKYHFSGSDDYNSSSDGGFLALVIFAVLILWMVSEAVKNGN